MNAYVKKTERPRINDLMLHLKLLGKQAQAKPKISRGREIIKIRVEINEIETKKKKKPNKPYKESTKQKPGSLKKINKIDKPLANLTKMRREKTQTCKIRNEKGEITTNTKEIQGNTQRLL
jgi:hypothetical protein